MKLKSLTLTFIIFRTQVKVWKNKAKFIVYEHPTIALSICIGLVIFAYLSWFFLAKFNQQISETEAIGGTTTLSSKLVINFLTVVIVGLFSIITLGGAKSGSVGLLEVIRVAPYRYQQIKRAMLAPSLVLVTGLSFSLLTPYSLTIFRLVTSEATGILYLLFVQLIYLISSAALANSISQIINAISYRFFRIRQEEALASANAALAVFVILGFIWLLSGPGRMGPLLTEYFETTIAIVNTNDWAGVANDTFGHLGRLLTVATLYYLIDSTLSSSWHDIQKGEKRKGKLSFRPKRTNPYFVLILKKFSRSPQESISLLSAAALFLAGAIAVGQIQDLVSFTPGYFQLFGYAMIMSIGVFVMNYDDYDILKTIKTFNGSMIKYNAILYIALSTILAIFFATSYLLAATLLHIRLEMLTLLSSLYCLIYVLIAMICKTLFLGPKSDLFIKVLGSYGFMVSVMVVMEMIMKLKSQIVGKIDLHPFIAEGAIISLIIFLLFLAQNFLLARRYQDE